MMDENRIAVSVRSATKFYGSKKVLDNLCMTVEKGTIYGLLGASGCGKTTLLSCIVGRKKLQSGAIWALGGAPGTKECGIPGPLVGYMPQELALVAEFTVEGAVYYFGRIFEMDENKIEERFIYLSELLDLPPRDRYIKNCSGGQQRRVSFAASLVSDPQLLILDEPTVGLDPVLREKIWNYLTKIANSENVAVIITTHYIEETRQAHKIGLMRKGKLLAEESPSALLHKYNTDSLEDVFLLLSRQQTDGQLDTTVEPLGENLGAAQSTSSINSISMKELNSSIDPLTPPASSTKKKVQVSNAYGVNKYRLKALFGKNLNQIIRNPSGLMFMMLFPLVECFAFFIAVGTDITGINLAIVNDENYGNYCSNFVYNQTVVSNEDTLKCHFEGLSCRFIELFDGPMLNMIPYDNVEKAMDDVKHGHVVGVIHIPHNFSVSLEDRLTYINNVPSSVLNYSQMQTWLDMSNRQIGTVIKYKLIDKMKKFIEGIFADCQYPKKASEIPMKFEKAIFADYDDLFGVFMLPGILLTIMFFMGTTNASSIIITDRLEGVWDRSIVAGVSSLEILLTHLLTQLLILVVQTILVMILTFVIFKVDYIGSFSEIFALVLFQGTCGMTFGFLVSVVCNSHSMSNIVSTGSFYPLLLLCGLMWPLEGMPVFLHWLSLCTPFAIPILSLRNIMKKGWDITYLHVFDGFAVTVVWTLIFIIISLIEIKRKR